MTAANTTADDLKAEGADLVVLLVHEGAPAPTAPRWTTTRRRLRQHRQRGRRQRRRDHLRATPTWPTTARSPSRMDRPAGDLRPVVSAGQYGNNLNQLIFSVDPDTGQVVGSSQTCSPLQDRADRQLPGRPDVGIVDAAVAGPRCSAPGRSATSPARSTARRRPTAPENRGGESTLGNLVAEVQRWATERGRRCRADRVHEPRRPPRRHGRHRPGTYPSDADLQAGSQRPAVRQHPGQHGHDRRADREGAGAAVAARGRVPAVPRLGASGGFRYTYDPLPPQGERSPACGSTATPSSRGDLLGDGQLVPRVRRGQLLRVRRGHRQAGHRQVGPAGMVDYLAGSGRRSAAGGLRPARGRRALPSLSPGRHRRGPAPAARRPSTCPRSPSPVRTATSGTAT